MKAEKCDTSKCEVSEFIVILDNEWESGKKASVPLVLQNICKRKLTFSRDSKLIYRLWISLKCQ